MRNDVFFPCSTFSLLYYPLLLLYNVRAKVSLLFLSLQIAFQKGCFWTEKKIWRFQRAWMELLDQRGKLISFRQQNLFSALQHCFSRKSNPCNYPLNSRPPTPPLPKNNPVLLLSSPSSFLPPPQTIFLLPPPLSLSGSGKKPPWGQQRGKEGLQGREGGRMKTSLSRSLLRFRVMMGSALGFQTQDIRNSTLQGFYCIKKGVCLAFFLLRIWRAGIEHSPSEPFHRVLKAPITMCRRRRRNSRRRIISHSLSSGHLPLPLGHPG